MHPDWGLHPHPGMCTDQTSNFLVHGTTLKQLTHTGHGWFSFIASR